MRSNLPVVFADRVGSDHIKEMVGVVFEQMDISENSRTQYKREVVPLLNWLKSRQIHSGTLTDWKTHLKGRTDLSAASKAKQLTVAKTLFRELYRHDVLPKDITVGVRGFKVSKLHKRTPIADEQLKSVLDYINSDCPDRRTILIITLMYRQGLRRVEISRLSAEDFNFESNTLQVRGKGQDDTEAVDLHPITVEVAKKYLSDSGLKSGPLFPSPQGNSQPLSTISIWRLVTRVHRKLGVSATPHAYRKKFVTRLIQRTDLNILEIAGYSRHSSVETVRIYYERLDKQQTLQKFYSAMGD